MRAAEPMLSYDAVLLIPNRLTDAYSQLCATQLLGQAFSQNDS